MIYVIALNIFSYEILTLFFRMLRLAEDTAWHPVWSKEMDGNPILSKGYMLGYGPFRPWLSIAHWYLEKNLWMLFNLLLTCIV